MRESSNQVHEIRKNHFPVLQIRPYFTNILKMRVRNGLCDDLNSEVSRRCDIDVTLTNSMTCLAKQALLTHTFVSL